jgi:PAS domain S-box-containing protein
MSLEDPQEGLAWRECFMQLPLPAFWLDASGHIAQANHAAAALLGLQAQQLTGLCLAQFVAESQRAAFFWGLRHGLQPQALAPAAPGPQTPAAPGALAPAQSPIHPPLPPQNPAQAHGQQWLPLSPSGLALQALTLKPAAAPEQVLRAELRSTSAQARGLLTLHPPSAAAAPPELALQAKAAQGAGAALMLVDRDFRIQWVNPEFTRLSGYALDDIRGQTPAQVLHSPHTDATALHEMRQALSQGQRAHLDVLHRHRQGHEFWVRAVVQPVLDEAGQWQHYISVHQDETELHRLMEDLQRSNRLLEACQTMAGVGAWELDLPSGTVHWTRPIYRLLDTSPSEHTPSIRDLLRFAEGADRRALSQAFHEAQEHGHPFDLRFELVTARGRRLRARAMAAVRLEAGRPAKVFGALQALPQPAPLSE